LGRLSRQGVLQTKPKELQRIKKHLCVGERFLFHFVLLGLAFLAKYWRKEQRKNPEKWQNIIQQL
jgi:hypothetical protein